MRRVDLSEVREVIADRKRRFTKMGSRRLGEGAVGVLGISHDALARQERQERTTEMLEMMAREIESLRERSEAAE